MCWWRQWHNKPSTRGDGNVCDYWAWPWQGNSNWVSWPNFMGHVWLKCGCSPSYYFPQPPHTHLISSCWLGSTFKERYQFCRLWLRKCWIAHYSHIVHKAFKNKSSSLASLCIVIFEYMLIFLPSWMICDVHLDLSSSSILHMFLSSLNAVWNGLRIT